MPRQLRVSREAASRVPYDRTVALRLPRINRRSFLTSAVALAAAVRSASAQGGTKLILLGTGGGPRPRQASSGDTSPSQNLVKLAAGADVLVHAVMYPAAIDRLVARVPKAAGLKASILAHQTSAEDAGRVAQEAGVKTLVLSHFVPPDDPEVTEAMWLEAARRRFRGTVIVGRDLLEV